MADVLAEAAERLGRPLDQMFREIAAGLRSAAESTTGDLLTAWQAGRVTDDEFEATLRTLLVAGVSTGVTAGDLIGSTYLGRMTVGFTLADDVLDQLGKAAATARTLLDAADDPLPRLARLTVGESLNGLQQGTLRAYDAHGVTGYTRGLSAGACKLCRWLYKDGYVYPTSKPMHKHPGCSWVPVPVTR